MILASNSPALTPWRWMAATDITALTAHYATPSLWWAALTAAGASAAAAGWATWRTREARLAKTIKTARTRHKVRTNAKIAVAAGSTWMLVGSVWTPIGPRAGMQLALLGGGLAIAAPHLYRNRRRDSTLELAEPVAELAPPAEDPRLTRFRDHFCVQGTLAGARLHDFEKVPGGFRFHTELPLNRRVTFNHVKQLEDEIAALYDVPYDQVSVEPPESRSARRAVVTVLTATKAHEREEPWDGTSTYDPDAGTFNLGRYADSTRSRWQIHAPYSGACSGIVVGVQGSGKTGTLHVVASEIGQAKLCVECLAAQSCPQCTPRRFSALWMGDPQQQPFAVWRGRADVTAWGPISCVRMLSWMHAAMRHRSDFFGRMEWTDHLGRSNTGKGWFDPTPQFPQITGVIDEWPVISSDPDLGPYAVQFALDILREGRKVGFGLILGSQEADVDVLGDRGVRQYLRAFNACVHRSDRLAKQMLSIEGNPEDLPDGIHGVSYLKSLDQRSGIVQRPKHLREYLRPGENGVDVRAIADRIAADPITYDESIMRAIVPLGYAGPGQILSDDDGDWDISKLMPTAAEDDEHDVTDTTAGQAAPATAAPYAAVIHKALQDSPSADVFDLMESTGLSALEVHRAVEALVIDGHAVRHTDGNYAARI
ncbi:hypothetical protein [Actinomadura viridis]|uniref:Plasmid stabilization system protein ParE n=1 Tax=Actinomadura viridis TaxID=58110 RepID=A0A931GK54_9ACTN|nr:hypothetical protein [Actinomadura viridis]MBG6089855.1 plasmid stabilization system protein ParE [Actinomadura viridis]